MNKENIGRRFCKYFSQWKRLAREDTLQPIGLQFLLYYWHSTSSKVIDFYLICQSVCHFLLVININLGRILTVSEIWPLIAWNFPLIIAAKSLQMETWLLYWQPIESWHRPTAGTIADPLRLTV